MRKAFFAAALVLVALSSNGFSAIVTSIGSTSVVQGSSGGFVNVPISISSNSGQVALGAYLVDFSVQGTPAASLRTFSENTVGSTLFNTTGLIGFNSFDVSTTYSSNGTVASLSLLSSTPTSILVDTTGVLAFLPVSTNLPVGTYTLTGAITGIQNGAGLDIDGPVSTGTFTVTAVPEPSTFALLSFASMSIFAAQRIRRARSIAAN